MSFFKIIIPRKVEKYVKKSKNELNIRVLCVICMKYKN